MSYDLYFEIEGARDSAHDDRFRAYFEGRAHYKLFNEDEYSYENEDTGVYFLFGLDRGDDEESQTTWAYFNLNFYRPHTFALEAEPELVAFCNTFPVTVDDPQTDGIGHVVFSSQKFLDGWNRGNAFGYEAILTRHEESPPTLPTAKLEAMWRWNFQRRAYQDQLEEDVYVPDILLLRHEGTVRTAAIWPDGIASAQPEVDLLIVGRERLAPRRWLRRQKDMLLIPRETVTPLWQNYEQRDWPTPHFFLNYVDPPAPISRHVAALPSEEPELIGIPLDAVRNEELVQAALNKRGSVAP